jgi:septum site-determining protein MinD
MVKAENMMSVTDVKDILGIPLIGVVPDSEQVITASNRGEPLVLDDKVSIPGLAFINTARRIMGEAVEFIDFDSVTSTNPLKRLIKNLVKRSDKSY